MVVLSPSQSADLANLSKGRAERFGFALRSLPDGEVCGHHLDEVFTQASAIKIPILWELEGQAAAGELELSETMPVSLESGVGGCGVLQRFLPGVSQLALADIAVLMIVLSDNVATNLMIDRVGRERINNRLAALGLNETRLRRSMMDAAARQAGRENTSTPREAVELMAELHRLATSGDAAAAATEKVLRLAKESPVTKALKKIAPAASLLCKPGMLDGLRTEWAIVEDAGYAYAFTLMADGGADDAALQSLFVDAATALHQVVAG